MKIEKIAFIEAGASGVQLLKRFTVARVGTVLLSTILQRLGFQIRTFIEDVAEPDWRYVDTADLVCVSTLTNTAPRAYAIGDRARARGIPVVMGGAHPSFLPEEALRHADFVVRGEGDRALPELIRSLERGTPALSAIPNLSWRAASGAVRHNPQAPYLAEEELDRLPVPDFSRVHRWLPSTIYPLSTSRGCPFACSFCSVIGMFGRTYRFKSIPAVMKELRYIRTVSKATRFFVDDNFTAHRARSKDLLRAMIADGLTDPWSAQVRTDVAKDTELLKLMKAAGGNTLYIGFESINPKTLAAYNKKQDLKDVENCIRAVKDHGLSLHGMFVVGADSDDVSVIRATAEFASRCGIDTTQIVPLTPLPGTSLFDEMQAAGRILHTDWSKYNLQHVVFRPRQMTPETLQREALNAMSRFYSWKYIFERAARFDLHYAAIGLYGKTVTNQTIREANAYLEKLRRIGPKAA
jgi:radical SAM superfamily enzyme YgiQ (UPF0313 family)